MKYVDEFRNKKLIDAVCGRIKEIGTKKYRLMEVCGTHTMAIYKFGLKNLLPQTIELISGPGCPVCVTETSFIDRAIAYAKMKDAIIATFGDMLKVPGSKSSLERERADGANVKIVYSPQDALRIAAQEPNKKVIFLGIGFETTAPLVASSIIEAEKMGLCNFFVLCGHKLIPPALAALIDEGIAVDGFILPGHVSAIIGSAGYEFVARSYNTPCVITGFEPLDVIVGIYMLLGQLESQDRAKIEIQYRRVVRPEGNTKARQIMYEVFEACDAPWRGLGKIPVSGLRIRKKFSKFDAEVTMPKKTAEVSEPKGCLCGNVLKGLSAPVDCKLFGRRCTPEAPVGPCMVSSEGTCAAVYKYGR